ncbi:hypothetical protein ES319_D07G168600v1 [Gossypium barbadense]|uniref:JmjC domain-containing protein n=2 Tax=Gossypium TaxID=3633 RepID=A0A5J5QRR0_GOSBA|nr:hypothetical protein ES319_D07G168600v1 [Gossypium barbadense]KAB2021845.1 hypothetical protein ES319_D07G168600v1 [Gossypium barbadense]TYG61825.1 hypothetical protein ES288_D07G180300v1 [Gossypium darwinii]TYG61826.1 hypothetical protein ES288_D07G180300v1 [Gossypium darwinii]
MGAEHRKTPNETDSRARVSAPPGFAYLSSFFLKKVEHHEENMSFKTAEDFSTQNNVQVETSSNVFDVEKLKKSIGNRPWILNDKTDQITKEYQSAQPFKTTSRQCLGDTKGDVLEEAPVFRPSEEEFSDTLKYIESIRLKAEPYGLCRIIPPPSWQPPCLIKEKSIWEYSKFVAEIQQFDRSPAQSEMGKEPGLEFTLKRFKKHADDFIQHYFFFKDVGHVNCKREELSVESIEGEYRKIVENPSGKLEVLYGDLDTATFGSGFPIASNTGESCNKYIRSSWNLNNAPKLPGSLLSFESDKNSSVSVPHLRIGMCFSSLYWITRLSPFVFKSKGVPVYRIIQYPREFVLVFPGAYHSTFDCGFNVAEAVTFAPLDWLPHGQNAVALYQSQGRKTSISFDKLLIGAAREAVKAQWELILLKKNTIDNLRWKGYCGKNGILTETLKSRVKQEGMRREYLCSTFQTKRKDKNFNSTSKRECSICYFDLHLSAVHCSCSSDRYLCLNHAKRLCSCTWTEKIFLYKYEINELNMLVEAVEGTLSAVHAWAREDLNLGLRHYTPKEKSFREDEGKKAHKLQDAVTSYGNGLSAVSSIKAEIKARIQQLQCLHERKSKEEMVSTPSLPRVTQDDTSLLLREVMPEDLSSSSSESDDTTDLDLDDGGKGCVLSTLSSRPSPSQPASEREVTLSQRRRPPKRKVTLSELLKDNSSEHGTAKHFKSTSEGLPMSHPASKKRKKK